MEAASAAFWAYAVECQQSEGFLNTRSYAEGTK
jgi:hypothetical protein